MEMLQKDEFTSGCQSYWVKILWYNILIWIINKHTDVCITKFIYISLPFLKTSIKYIHIKEALLLNSSIANGQLLRNEKTQGHIVIKNKYDKNIKGKPQSLLNVNEQKTQGHIVLYRSEINVDERYKQKPDMKSKWFP